MVTIIRTNSTNNNFQQLVKLLDEELAILYGDEHAFYNQFNKTDEIKYVLLAMQDDKAAGCGAIKKYNSDSMEIKRMYCVPALRGIGIATNILQGLEAWAAELNFKKCMLETGIKQPEAIGLYKKNGYKIIANYCQYANMQNSVCFEKILN